MRNKGRNEQQEPVMIGPRVSELLKTSRERSGQDLQTVSQVLRIRFVYLEAIEGGRYEELPGKTYVVGFVRAYADYLGLDAEEVVNRFKAEVDGLEGRSELMFPSPVTEQSVPGGAIILIGLIILAGAYGGWYFLSSQDRSIAELVPDLPAKFSEMVDSIKNGNDTAQEVAEQAETEPTQQPVETPVAEASEPVSEADTQAMAQKALAAVEQSKAEESETPQTLKTVKVEEQQSAPETNSEPANTPAVESAQSSVATTEEVSAQNDVQEEKTETPAAVEEKTVEAAATPAEPAGVEAATETVEPAAPQPMTEKVVLKAVDYSWIQVTDGDGKVLHTEVLNEGDQYQVPQTHGLILRTGNAGGLEIYVDDKKTPNIGDAGEVRRKVLLDPQKLLAGKAVEN